MLDKTRLEIVRAFFMPSDQKGVAADPRTEVLVALVFDLLLEVEALRAALLSSDAGTAGKASAYARAYQDTAYLTHNACGPSSGLEKLLALYYPQAAESDDQTWGERRTWRECLFLRRLGFSEEEIRAYKEAAAHAETFT